MLARISPFADGLRTWGVLVGYAKKRAFVKGVRWTAVYRDARGKERSAGTFTTKKAADQAWQAAEVLLRAGRAGEPRTRKLSFAEYVNLSWFPNHILEPTTRESYRYCLDRHILPWFGPMKIRDILPTHVREWVQELISQGVSPAQIRHLRIILSAVFTTALNDFVVMLHPCKGVKTPTVPVKEFRIVSPDEMRKLQRSLPSPIARLLVQTSIDSGLRWGELTELRPSDLDRATGIVTVRRAAVEVNPAHHPDGARFLVKPYPKSRRTRRLKLPPALVTELGNHIDAAQLTDDDLIFDLAFFLNSAPRRQLMSVDQLGLTEPNAAGRRYPHGTLSAYTAGHCRCDHCRGAFAEYRAMRRASGRDAPRRPRMRETDGHIPRDWFRHQVWIPACTAADLKPRPRLHDLRHSHASWLLAGGADLEVVRERLGHGNIATTSKYLHTLPTADDTALTALERVQRGSAI
jgi:integrase